MFSMDNDAATAVAFASKTGLRDVRVLSSSSIGENDRIFELSGILEIDNTRMSSEDRKVLAMFLDGPFQLRVTVRGGRVVSHEWDQIQFS